MQDLEQDLLTLHALIKCMLNKLLVYNLQGLAWEVVFLKSSSMTVINNKIWETLKRRQFLFLYSEEFRPTREVSYLHEVSRSSLWAVGWVPLVILVTCQRVACHRASHQLMKHVMNETDALQRSWLKQINKHQSCNNKQQSNSYLHEPVHEGIQHFI